MVDKIIKRIAGWRGRLLSYAGRLVLLKACLASIPIYLLSIIKFPKWAIKMINSQMGHFLWNNTDDTHKYHLASWQLVAQKKDMGGLGIPDLRSLNLALLSSWIFRYQLHKNAIWVNIVDYKYRTKDPNIFCCPDLGVSPFWKGWYGQLKQPIWASSGWLVIGRRSGFRRTNGQVILVWQLFFGRCMLLTSNMVKL